ncbi:hypothetical protein BCR42DRAFT_456270 [Absidia repens]|uniref:Uncharacterized protein n=1 Tax=Absidia repens TaxID=90262 RepID=A0A1X2I0V5_9FUNG|nr:hypothetical protein BCR42DRAFT_456270 [Absidia repens]
MDNSILDYDESLNDLERQKEQLELVMQKMGEEWEESGPGINWLKMLQNSKEISPNSTTQTTKTINTTAIVDDKDLTGLSSPLTPDASLDGNDGLINILQQQSQPSPEYLQSLLHVNETLLAQSLAASPLISDEDYVPTCNTNITTIAIASPTSEASSSDACTPSLNSASSMIQPSPPTTPQGEDHNIERLATRHKKQDKGMPTDSTLGGDSCLSDAHMNNSD